jgi:transglutaminase-like putative cysteine protease
MMSPAPNARRQAVVLLSNGILCALSVLVYVRFFTGRLWLVPLLGAAVLPGVVVFTCVRRGWTIARLLGLGIVLALVYIAYTLYPRSTYFGLPGAGSVRALWTGVGHGWIQLLTFGLPAPPVANLLAPIEGVTWTASLVGALIALRCAGMLSPLLPPFVAFVTALAFTATRSGTALLLMTAFVFVACAQMVLRGNGRFAGSPRDATGVFRPPRSWKSLSTLGLGVGAGALVTLASAGAVAAYAAGHHSRRLDPRTWVHPPPDVVVGVSPLAQVEGQMDAPVRHLFTVQLEAAGSSSVVVDRIKLVALDSFDGSEWTIDDSFERVGSTLPQSPFVDERASSLVYERVYADQPPEPFIPTLGEPLRSSGPPVAYDDLTGDLLLTSPGLGGYQYEGSDTVEQPTYAQLSVVPTYHGRGSAQLTALPPDLNPKIGALAKRAAGNGTTPISKLLSIQHFLKVNYSYQPDSAPGSSIASLQRFLLATMHGQAGQFAASFALLARAVGLPARVVVGYRLDAADKAGQGVFHVTTADADIWPEVDFTGYGWVAFDPVPDRRARSVASPLPVAGGDLGGRVGTPGRPRDQPTIEPTVVPGSGVPGHSPRGARDDGPILVGLVVGGIVILLPLLAAGAVLLAKALRRRKRASASSPAGRVVGAWSEICECLLTYGVTFDAADTPAEVIRRATPLIGASASSSLAAMEPIVSETTYSRGGPDGWAADRAWLLEARAREVIRRDAGLVTRCRAALDPRPLRPSSGSTSLRVSR